MYISSVVLMFDDLKFEPTQFLEVIKHHK